MDVGEKLAEAVLLRWPVGYRSAPVRCSESPLPYKANQPRRHRIPKARYKVANWAEYDAALRRRGSLTVWVTPEAIAAWTPAPTGRRGPPRDYSDIALESGLMLRLAPRLREDKLRSAVGSDRRPAGLDHGAARSGPAGARPHDVLAAQHRPGGRDGPEDGERSGPRRHRQHRAEGVRDR